MISFTFRPLYFRAESPRYSLDRRLGGLDDVERRKIVPLPGIEL
jgi:hypothetical protein